MIFGLYFYYRLYYSYYRLYNKELYKREQEIFIAHRNSWYHNTLVIIVCISELSSVSNPADL